MAGFLRFAGRCGVAVDERVDAGDDGVALRGPRSAGVLK